MSRSNGPLSQTGGTQPPFKRTVADQDPANRAYSLGQAPTCCSDGRRTRLCATARSSPSRPRSSPCAPGCPTKSRGSTPTAEPSSSTPSCSGTARKRKSSSPAQGPTRRTTSARSSRRTGQSSARTSATTASKAKSPGESYRPPTAS